MESIVIESTDTDFMVSLIKWLNNQPCKPNATTTLFSGSDVIKRMERVLELEEEVKSLKEWRETAITLRGWA